MNDLELAIILGQKGENINKNFTDSTDCEKKISAWNESRATKCNNRPGCAERLDTKIRNIQERLAPAKKVKTNLKKRLHNFKTKLAAIQGVLIELAECP